MVTLPPAGTELTVTSTLLPLVVVYAAGLDWALAGQWPDPRLGWLLLVTYLAGFVLEIGRKIRVPEDERFGVDTFSARLGPRTAALVWLGLLAGGLLAGWIALAAAGRSAWTFPALGAVFLGCAWPAWSFYRKPNPRTAKAIEHTASLWMLVAHAVLSF